MQWDTCRYTFTLLRYNSIPAQCDAGLTQSLSLYPGWATPTAEWSSHYDGEDDENGDDYDENGGDYDDGDDENEGDYDDGDDDGDDDGGEDDEIMSQQCWVNICAGLESELWLT